MNLFTKLAVMAEVIPRVIAMDSYGSIVDYLWRYFQLYEKIEKNRCLFILRILVPLKIFSSKMSYT